MKSTEAANRIGIVASSTIRQWTKTGGEWRQYVSEAAKGTGRTREYTVHDLRVLHYIATRRTIDGADASKVHQELQAMQADDWKDLPRLDDETDEQPKPVMVSSDAVSVKLDNLTSEIERLQTELDQIHDDNEALQNRLQDAIAEREKLRGRLETFEAERRGVGFWLRIIAIIITVMVVISGLLIWLVLSIGTA